MKTLILFSTRDGQTREIASFLASELKELGIDADTLNLNRTDVVEWHHYDRVVIGASIRYGHFHPAVDRFVKKHLAALQALPGAFFSVNLVARKPEKRTPQTNSYTRKFLLNSPWQPQSCAVFAGALRYPRYSWYDRFMIRLIMKMTGGETDTRKEVVYTDWQQVSRFAREIAQMARKTRVVMENRANEKFFCISPCHLRITPYNAPPLTRNNGKQTAGSAGFR